MRQFRKTDELDCKTCGACCVGEAGDFVPVTALDRRRLPTKYERKLTTPVLNVTVECDSVVRLCAAVTDKNIKHALGLKRFGKHQSCVALKGTLGKDVHCDIYDYRPDFCRQFERGSVDCHARRAEMFVITP